MSRLLAAASLVLASLLYGAADEVVWPQPQPPAGTPAAQFPVAAADTNFFNHIVAARSQQTDMILDGDSITDYWQSTGRPVFDKVFAPRRAIDFGMSGNQTENVLWRVDHGELDTLHPKLAMLLIGTNNMGGPVDQIPVDHVAAGITKIVQEYRAKCPDMHILLLGIFPHWQSPTDPARAKIKEINALIAKLDDGEHVTYLDIGDKLVQPDGTISPEVMPDFLHPALKGYEIWAAAVQPMLDKYCPIEPATPAASTTPAPSPAQVAAAVPPLTWPYALDPPAGTPTDVFPTYPVGWFRLFQQSLDRLKNGPYDLVFDGDTRMGDWEGRGHDAIQAHWASIKRLNLGQYGDHTENILWRVRHGSLDGQNPKLIVLQVGDSQIGNDVNEVAGGTKLILDEYKKRCPGAHILLLGVFPRPEDANSAAWTQKMNATYATLADDRITYLDFGDKIRQTDGAYAGNFDLSEKGYAAWAEAMQPAIDKYIPAAPKTP